MWRQVVICKHPTYVLEAKAGIILSADLEKVAAPVRLVLRKCLRCRRIWYIAKASVNTSNWE